MDQFSATDPEISNKTSPKPSSYSSSLDHKPIPADSETRNEENGHDHVPKYSLAL